MISNQFVTSWQTSAFAAAWLTVNTSAALSSPLIFASMAAVTALGRRLVKLHCTDQ